MAETTEFQPDPERLPPATEGALIVDLEDAVPPAEKPAARQMVSAALARPRACRGMSRPTIRPTKKCGSS